MGTLAHSALSIGAAAALLAGCGVLRQAQDDTPLPIGAAPTTIDAAVTPNYKVSGPLLFVTNLNSRDAPVTVYDATENNPRPIVAIFKGINGVAGDCVDRDGTLYVLSEFDGVSEFALGTTKPFKKITEGIGEPTFCAIDGRGNLWVTNVSGNHVNASEYVKGGSKPHFRITRGLTDPEGIAIDQAGNIYVGNRAPTGSSNVQVYRRGKKIPYRTITDGVTWPVGIAIDPKGALYVANYGTCNIEEYLPGQDHPYRTITKDIDGPSDITFARNGRMYVVNLSTQGCQSNGEPQVILEFPPGKDAPLKRHITKALHDPLGVAHYPPALP